MSGYAAANPQEAMSTYNAAMAWLEDASRAVQAAPDCYNALMHFVYTNEYVAECKANCDRWNRRGAPETVGGDVERISSTSAPRRAQGRALDPAPTAVSTGEGVPTSRKFAESVGVCLGPEVFHVNPTDESRALALRVFAAVCRTRNLATAEAARQCIKIDRVSAIEGDLKLRVVTYYGKRVHVYLTQGVKNAHRVQGARTGTQIRRFLNLPDNQLNSRQFCAP